MISQKEDILCDCSSIQAINYSLQDSIAMDNSFART